MSQPSEDHLIYDWSVHGDGQITRPAAAMLDDETLRDGLQSPSVIDPPLDAKVRLLHLMNRLGIETANIGLPGSGPRQREAVETLCREIADNGLQIFGGHGYIRDYPVEMWYRNTRTITVVDTLAAL